MILTPFKSQIFGQCPDCCSRYGGPADLVCRSWGASRSKRNPSYRIERTLSGSHYTPVFYDGIGGIPDTGQGSGTASASGTTVFEYDSEGALINCSGSYSFDTHGTFDSTNWGRLHMDFHHAFDCYGHPLPESYGNFTAETDWPPYLVIPYENFFGPPYWHGGLSPLNAGDGDLVRTSSTVGNVTTEVLTYSTGLVVTTVTTLFPESDSDLIASTVSALPSNPNGSGCFAYAHFSDDLHSYSIQRSQCAVRFYPPSSCYLKIWFTDTTEVTGGETTVVNDSIAPYEWRGLGTGSRCRTHPNAPWNAEVNMRESEWFAVLNEPTVSAGQEIKITRSIRKWSFVSGYEPDDNASHSGYSGSKPNGWPIQ